MAVGRPIPHTAHLRDCSTGSIGYSYEVRPTFRLLPWAISPTHCTTRTQLTIIDSIGQRRLRQCMPYCIRPRLRYYKRSYSFNPQSRFPDHSAESTGGLHRPNGILSRTSKTLSPWLQHRLSEISSFCEYNSFFFVEYPPIAIFCNLVQPFEHSFA